MAFRESSGGGKQTACGPARDTGDTPPSAGLGLALSVQPTWGQTASGVQWVWETGISQGGVPANWTFKIGGSVRMSLEGVENRPRRGLTIHGLMLVQ